MIITGTFNCRSILLWENDIENREGNFLEQLVADNGLHQLISEPTHFVGSSQSCIDLILTDQLNLSIDIGVHPFLHDQCHHQIFHGAPYAHRIWHDVKSVFIANRRSTEMFR